MPLGPNYHIENMPVVVPNSQSFYRNNDRYRRMGEYTNENDNIEIMKLNYNKYNDNNNNFNNYNYRESFSRMSNIGDKNNMQEYIYKLERRNDRLENINNIFLNMLKEQRFKDKMLMRNRSMDYISPGSYPYLSYDKYGNKNLLYLDRDSINNNKIINGNYTDNYLVPLLPKNNSVADNNKALYLLNNEKLKLCRNDLPYFNYENYNNRYNNNNIINNIPQKANSVEYTNKKLIFKKYNSNKGNMNNITNNNENDKSQLQLMSNKSNNNEIINEMYKINNNLIERLKKIEQSQNNQKKDIDFLMGKTKSILKEKKTKTKSKASSSIVVKTSSNIKSIDNTKIKSTNELKNKDKNKEIKDKKSDKKSVKKSDKKTDKKSDKKSDKKTDKKSDKKEKSNDEDDDSVEVEDDEEEDDDDDDDEENEKELDIKSFNSEDDE